MAARWAVFLSGRGSNAQTAFEEMYHLEIALCVSSKKNALGVARARRAGVPVLILDKNPDFLYLHQQLLARKIDRIMLLGYMKILPEQFCKHWQGRIWNLHPSILPDNKGAHAIERSYADGKKMGISIHEVTAEMDAGKVLRQFCISSQARVDFKNIADAGLRISQAEQVNVRKFMKDSNISIKGMSEYGCP